MKKFLKATALILAAAFTLTACGSSAKDLSEAKEMTRADQSSSVTEEDSEDVQIDTEALSLYATSPVTQVEDQLFTMDDREGYYTGDWKGNRPEGQGKFIIGDYDYYSGEWYNGMLSGQGEMQKTYDDGTWKRFEGMCNYNQPSGEGRMYIGSFNDQYLVEIQGDFSNESTLMYYMTDGTGKLVDMGGLSNGGYVSYVGNPNVTGVAFKDWVRNDMDKVAWFTEAYEGSYIGQVDENGVPNGYGYSFSNKYHRYVYKLGTWKDGKIEGYYTEWWKENGLLKTRVGSMKDGVDVGEYTLYTGNSLYSLVKKNNCDTSFTYELCDDGIYRTDYTTKEYYYSDGRYEYQKYLTFKYDPDDWKYYYEGTYAVTDVNGNIIECGEADPEAYCDLYWESYEEINKKDLINKLAPVVAVGLFVGIGAYAINSAGKDFESSAAGRFLASTTNEIAYTMEESRLYDTIMEKVEEEWELGNTYNAEQLLEEANKHRVTIF